MFIWSWGPPGCEGETLNVLDLGQLGRVLNTKWLANPQQTVFMLRAGELLEAKVLLLYSDVRVCVCVCQVGAHDP